MKALVYLLLVSYSLQCLAHVTAEDCVLNGLWYDPASTRDEQLLFNFTSLPDYGETVIAITPNGQWATGVVFFDRTMGSLTVSLDNGGKQVGALNLSNCKEIHWSVPPGPVWNRVPQVKEVHVVFMNHLDVGYNGIPKTGFIVNVLNMYFQEYFPRAIRLAAEMSDLYPEGGFIYTTHPWLIKLYLDCPPYLFLNGVHLECPTENEVNEFEFAIQKGYITWHAGPMNMQIELMNEAVLKAGLQVSQDLDLKFEHKTTVLSQRDVPGLTISAIPFFSEYGIEAVTVGVNSGSAPPAVPNLFQWEYEGQSVIAMWHPGGYPSNPGSDLFHAGGLSIMDCVIQESSQSVLAFAFRTDNSGPPSSVQEILTYYEILQGEFPGANIIASTFEKFINSIDKSSLPVISEEIGDSWIQGIASDPRKIAEFQAASSGYFQCIQEKQCNVADPQVKNATLFLIKLSEHTWGLPDVNDKVNWTNFAFQRAKHGTNYINCENSWLEQRLFLNLTIQASYGHPLHDYINKALADLRPSIPCLDGYNVVDPSQSFKLFDGKVTVTFSSTGGWISGLIYRNNTTVYTLADSKNPLALFSYHTYNESDFEFMNSLYDYYGNAGYDKPNSTQNAHPNNSVYYSQLLKLYQSQTTPEAFIILLQFDSDAHHYYGAPEMVWIRLLISKKIPPTIELVSLSLELIWINKMPTRLAEAMMFSFYPSRQYSNTTWHGSIQKISNHTPIELNNVITNGSQLQHAAKGVTLREISSFSDKLQVWLSSPDIPLVCPIMSTITSPTPFPAPLTPTKDLDLKGIAFNLHNNIWNTNYPLWYPFAASDKNFKARFEVKFMKSTL